MSYFVLALVSKVAGPDPEPAEVNGGFPVDFIWGCIRPVNEVLTKQEVKNKKRFSQSGAGKMLV